MSNETRPPLGLPRGSIRALLTLLIVAVVISQLIRGQEVQLLWTETLMIALAHYFASRRFIRLPPDVIKRLVAEGHIELEARPLYLPSYSIRVLLITAFALTGVYLFRQGRLFEQQSLSILGVVFAYLLGVFARLRSVPGWENFKALAVLGVLAATSLAELCGYGAHVPNAVRSVTLGMVLFYFGSR
jgi:hypothetical protein